MSDVTVSVSIKGVVVGTITLESDGNPSITVTWKTGESMVVTGPAMLLFHHGYRTIILYWDGVVLRDRTNYTVSEKFPRCAYCVHSNASEFCTVWGFPLYNKHDHQYRSIDNVF
jgi:hypothetical protein